MSSDRLPKSEGDSWPCYRAPVRARRVWVACTRCVSRAGLVCRREGGPPVGCPVQGFTAGRSVMPHVVEEIFGVVAN